MECWSDMIPTVVLAALFLSDLEHNPLSSVFSRIKRVQNQEKGINFAEHHK